MTCTVKKNIWLVLVVLSCSYYPRTIIAAENVDLIAEERNDFSSLDQNSDDYFTEDGSRIPCLPAPDIANLLVTFGVINLLQEQLYLKTCPLNNRSLLYSPLFLPMRLGDYTWTVGGHLFWNQTTRMYFARQSSSLCSYLGITQPTLLSKLASLDILSSLGFQGSADTILSLFKNMTVTQRRSGIMFYGQRAAGRFGFRIMTPLEYVENNFYVTEEEQTAIERALGQTTNEEQMEFAEQHLIADAIGLGDTRFVFSFMPFEDSNPETTIGVFGTIPTGWAFKRGLMGSSFQHTCPPLELDFVELVDLACNQQQAQAAKIGENFMLGALDTFAANMLYAQLGNGGHWSLGLEYNSVVPLKIFIKRPWAQDVVFKNRTALEYLFPATERRFFTQCSSTSAYEALGLERSKQQIIAQINSDPVYAATVLDFFEQELTEKFYTYPFKARVSPGITYQTTTKAFYEGLHWGVYLGSDTWVRTKATLSHIRKTSPLPTAIDRSKAVQPFAFQSKLFGGIFYKMPRTEYDITLGLNADDTIISSGIGKDFTVSLNLEMNF